MSKSNAIEYRTYVKSSTWSIEDIFLTIEVQVYEPDFKRGDRVVVSVKKED